MPPLMQGSTSPSKNGESPNSGPQVTRSRTTATAAPRGLALRLQPEVPQEQQREQVGPPARPGDVVAPVAVRPLLAEELRAPSFEGHARPRGGHDLGRLVEEVPHHLPADRRIRIEQPRRDVHGRAHSMT